MLAPATRDLVKPGVRFVQADDRARSTRSARRVETDAGTFEADVLVVALGADLDPAATPGLVEGGHEFYTVAGAFALRDVLADFDGGRVVVGVTSTPFKCPPAPSETALLMHDFLDRARACASASEISLVMPLRRADPAVAGGVRGAARRVRRARHRVAPGRAGPRRSTRRARSPCSATASELPYDLFLGVPVHRAPAVVRRVRAVRRRLDPGRPAHAARPRSPACTRSATSPASARPKAGVFAEGQAAVVADAIIAARIRGEAAVGRRTTAAASATSSSATTRSRKVDVTFLQRPGARPATSRARRPTLAADKAEFGTEPHPALVRPRLDPAGRGTLTG